MKILCINGQGGVGKDSFVCYCGGTTANDIFSFSMADAAKKIAYGIGWNGKKDLKDRLFLSKLKDLIDNYNDYSFQTILKNIEYIMVHYENFLTGSSVPENEFIFFVHSREPKDLDRWRKQYGARAVLVRRPQVEGKFGNHADDDVFNYDYDYYIDNSGTLKELREKAVDFIKQVREEEWSSWV